MGELDGRAGAPPAPGLTANEAERILAPLIQSWERVLTAQGQQFTAMAGRIEQMAKSLDADRQQNVALLEQARATMEVAVALATQFDEQIAGLVEVSLALSTVYDEAQAQQQEEL
jgi:hypothetical protein